MLRAHQPFTALQVLGLRYWHDRLLPDDEAALDAYRATGAYDDSGTSVSYAEPIVPPGTLTGDPVENLGRLCGLVAAHVADACRSGRATLFVGGTCCHAIGIVGGLQQAFGADTRIGIVWLDAHGDFNTPTTTRSGRLSGMPLAVCAGLAHPLWRELGGMLAPIPTDRIILIDARHLNPLEAQLIQATNVAVVPPGADTHLTSAVAALAIRCDLLYLHIDADILAPAFMPTASLREPDGTSLEETITIVKTTLATGKLVAAAMVSVRNSGAGRETSVASGASLIRSTLTAWRQYGVARA